MVRAGKEARKACVISPTYTEKADPNELPSEDSEKGSKQRWVSFSNFFLPFCAKFDWKIAGILLKGKMEKVFRAEFLLSVDLAYELKLEDI